ncbi:MAG: META domain-containing protein [Candidatus Yonathbacteria bacterium]|nr:META domain-containing protein [Candidatus Yonathbacteria bacterium]
MKKALIIIVSVIAVLVVGVAVAGIVRFNFTDGGDILPPNTSNTPIDIPKENGDTPVPIVGGDSDEHGCKASAGYSWCEVKNKCLRPWEEACVASGGTTASSLVGKKWMWVRTTYTDGQTVTPKKADTFGLTFDASGHVSVATDCNSMGGSYVTKGSTLTFSGMMSTLMYCEGSQESEFSAMLANVATFSLTSEGRLLLKLRNNEGEMVLQ